VKSDAVLQYLKSGLTISNEILAIFGSNRMHGANYAYDPLRTVGLDYPPIHSLTSAGDHLKIELLSGDLH
jgi:hypothetical protein